MSLSGSTKVFASIIIPPLTFNSHKGQAGKIGIVGGSKNNTGAPYFAAISALKVGGDLAHVFCTQDASQVIKSYSPELIVHPTLGSPDFIKDIGAHLPFLHSLVIGPGLGRDQSTFQSISALVRSAVKRGLPLIFDGDGLFYLMEGNYKDIVGYEKAILTPNNAEFKRLFKAVTGREAIAEDPVLYEVEVYMLAEELGHVTIIRKGQEDSITDARKICSNVTLGCPRRCRGQGSVLAGIMGVFHFWAHKAKVDNPSMEGNPSVIAATQASSVTRHSGYLAFQKYKRSTLTSDVIGEIGEAFSSLYDQE